MRPVFIVLEGIDGIRVIDRSGGLMQHVPVIAQGRVEHESDAGKKQYYDEYYQDTSFHTSTSMMQ